MYHIVREYEKLEDFREYNFRKRIKILENKFVANSAPADQKKTQKNSFRKDYRGYVKKNCRI